MIMAPIATRALDGICEHRYPRTVISIDTTPADAKQRGLRMQGKACGCRARPADIEQGPRVQSKATKTMSIAYTTSADANQRGLRVQGKAYGSEQGLRVQSKACGCRAKLPRPC
ncbi:hypothetical protein LZ554_004348 [Drepanopeziza brunnea f. sp. 'monogermtubi']|nr:hypothetical protein LZ554_004348 [Drepanopeziza brunnea f. sp. 'monogermtubi']